MTDLNEATINGKPVRIERCKVSLSEGLRAVDADDATVTDQMRHRNEMVTGIPKEGTHLQSEVNVENLEIDERSDKTARRLNKFVPVTPTFSTLRVALSSNPPRAPILPGASVCHVTFMATRTLCVLDLPVAVTKDFLWDFFNQYGVVQEVKVVDRSLDPKCDTFYYAFVTFASHSDASKAIEKTNYTKMDGTEIRLIWSDPETDAIRKSMENLVVIMNLAPSTQEFDLDKIFAEFGDLIYCEIPRDPVTRQPLEYGFVQFRNKASALRAVQEMRGVSIGGRRIEVMMYQKKE